MTDDVLLHAIAEINRYRLATAGDAEFAGIGAMSQERWKAFFETMAADGVYPTNLDWRQAYSLDFLPGTP
jgi:NitT/TauT family transport system substrate-binding protein